MQQQQQQQRTSTIEATHEAFRDSTKSRIKLDAPREGTTLARELLDAFRRHSDRLLLVDAHARAEWTGARLLDDSGRLATGLVRRLGLRPNQIVMTICEHTGMEIVAALGVVLAGAALYGTTPRDGYAESKMLCELAKPDVLIVSSRLHEWARSLKSSVASMGDCRIVWLDTPSSSSKIAASYNTITTLEEEDLNNNNNSSNYYKDSNNNNNELDQKDLVESIIQRDQVHLLEELIASNKCDHELLDSIADEQIKPSEHILTYMLTSGSTGRPKVVPSTHEELVYGLYSMLSATRHQVAKGAEGAEEAEKGPNTPNGHLDSTATTLRGPLLPLERDDVISGDLPLDHGAGLNTMFLSFCLGCKYVVMPSYEVDAFWQAVNDFRITKSISSTTFGYKLFQRLKQLIDARQPDKWDLSSFRFIGCAGAKLAFVDVIREVTRWPQFAQIRVSQCYGCTEIGFISMVHQDESSSEHLHSTGYLFPGIQVKVVADDTSATSATSTTRVGPNARPSAGRALGANQRGELQVYARSKFKGYRCHRDDDPRAIYAQCHDQWGLFYRSGDQAHLDAEGRLHIHGRFKDTLVLMEDWKILPAELEELVNEHPLVEMSAIIGKPDPNLPGCHAPKAFVKLISALAPPAQGEGQPVEQQLMERLRARDFAYISRHIYEFVAERTARPKHLTGGVRIVAEFPRVGLLNKIDRKALHQLD